MRGFLLHGFFNDLHCTTIVTMHCLRHPLLFLAFLSREDFLHIVFGKFEELWESSGAGLYGAIAAGIGAMGWSGNVLHPDHGARQARVSVPPNDRVLFEVELR